MMRCMTAICPAGPPKLRAATFSHTRSASPIEGNTRAASVAAGAADTSCTSGSRSLRMPGMGFVRGVPAPPVECVVERHPGFELREVVRIHPRPTKRQREQPGGLRCGVHAAGVGAPYDRRQTEERLGCKAELFHHDIEGAGIPAVAPEYAFDVEGCCGKPLRHTFHLRGSSEQKYGAGLDVTTVQ